MAYSLQLVDLLDSQRRTGKMTDVILVCEGREFPAHKNVLCATSKYFQSMFKPGWDESGKDRIELPTVTAREMEVILQFLYTGKHEYMEDPPLLKSLLKTSHMLQVDVLFESCYKELCKTLSSTNFLEILRLAELISNEMKGLVVNFLAQHFFTASKSQEFLELTAEQLQTIAQCIDNDNSSIDNVIEGLLRWAEVKPDREKGLLVILTVLDLKDVSTKFLMELLQKRTLVKQNLHILTLLTAEATSRLLHKDLNKENESKVLCFDRINQQHSLTIYDINQNQWLQPKDLPFRLEAGMSMIAFDDNVYVFGGGNSGDWVPSAKVIKYNPTTNEVISIGLLEIPVLIAGVGILYKSIYVVNGLNAKRKAVTTVQRFTPHTGISKVIASTNHTHNRPNVLSNSTYLYILGPDTNQNSVERYDCEADQWTVITKIPGEINWCSAAIFANKLFVVSSEETNELQECNLQERNLQGNNLTRASWGRDIDAPGVWVKRELAITPNCVLGLYASTFQGRDVLLVCGDKGALYTYDAEKNKLVCISEPNVHEWSVWHTCVM